MIILPSSDRLSRVGREGMRDDAMVVAGAWQAVGTKTRCERKGRNIFSRLRFALHYAVLLLTCIVAPIDGAPVARVTSSSLIGGYVDPTEVGTVSSSTGAQMAWRLHGTISSSSFSQLLLSQQPPLLPPLDDNAAPMRGTVSTNDGSARRNTAAGAGNGSRSNRWAHRARLPARRVRRDGEKNGEEYAKDDDDDDNNNKNSNNGGNSTYTGNVGDADSLGEAATEGWGTSLGEAYAAQGVSSAAFSSTIAEGSGSSSREQNHGGDDDDDDTIGVDVQDP